MHRSAASVSHVGNLSPPGCVRPTLYRSGGRQARGWLPSFAPLLFPDPLGFGAGGVGDEVGDGLAGLRAEFEEGAELGAGGAGAADQGE